MWPVRCAATARAGMSVPAACFRFSDTHSESPVRSGTATCENRHPAGERFRHLTVSSATGASATIRCSGIPVCVGVGEHDPVRPRRGMLVAWRRVPNCRGPALRVGTVAVDEPQTTLGGPWAPAAGREVDQVRSEIRVQILVRPSMKRRLLRCAGSIRGANAACRGLTPDPATPVRAVAGSGVDASR